MKFLSKNTYSALVQGLKVFKRMYKLKCIYGKIVRNYLIHVF